MGIYFTAPSTFVYIKKVKKKKKTQKLSNGFIVHPEHSKIFNMGNKAVTLSVSLYLSNFLSHYSISHPLHLYHQLPCLFLEQ